MKTFGRRRGVASVIGALFMVVIFMLAVGAQTYMSGLQAQQYQVAQEARQVAAQKADELAVFSTPAAGVTVTNSGSATLNLTSMIMEFDNGSVYSLGPGSSPAFLSVPLLRGASVSVRSLVPNGICKDQLGAGTATCLSKFNSIVNSTIAGRDVGLVTSMGNVFWYVPSSSLVKWSQLGGFPQPCSPGSSISTLATVPTCSSGSGMAVRVTANLSNTAYNSWVPALSIQLSANTSYVFEAVLAVYSTGSGGGWDVRVPALPAGSTFQLGCIVTGTTSLSGNAYCNHKAGTPPDPNIGLGRFLIQYYGALTVGATAGPLAIDFVNWNYPGSTTMIGGSFLTVQPVA